MNNRNIVLFVAATLALLVIQFWASSRFVNPITPLANPSVETISTNPSATTTIPSEPQLLASQNTTPLVAATSYTVTVATNEIEFLFSAQNGALLQAKWLRDGTSLLPVSADGLETYKGLGRYEGSLGSHRLVSRPTETELTFFNSQGDQLAWVIPNAGYILRAEFISRSNQKLNLLPVPTRYETVASLGRIFSIDANGIQTETWSSILKDPFFSFFGASRKSLIPSTSLMGLDLGVEPKGATTNHFFMGVWNTAASLVVQEPNGYKVSGTPSPQVLSLYIGPKEINTLAAFNPLAAQAVDFGFFGAIAKGLFYVLKAIHQIVGNWGWTIVVFTLVLRILLWWPNSKQTISMLRMKDFEPHQKSIQAKYEKYGNDFTKKAEMQKELMEMYKKNGHNPMGGCLPMLLQMPVLFALWSMLQAVFELRNAPFIWWISNLSAKDPYYILPVLMGVGMVVQSVMTPAMGDPTQRKIMLVMMPVMMVFIFSQSPSGLCLYYLVFTLVGIAQTWWVKRNYISEPIKI